MNRIIPVPLKTDYIGEVCSDINNIEYIINSDLKTEQYILRVLKSSVQIEYSSINGKFYAEKTLEQLKLNNSNVDCQIINDCPRFEYRGFMIDSARHFFSTDELKKIINAASLYKLNRFHWHLCDDQGFRIQLDNFKDAYILGSVRKCDNFGKHCSDNKPHSGYYTKDEIRDIVSFCAERCIEVVPELDIPGHCSALLHAYPELGCQNKRVEVKDTNGIFADVLCVGKKHTIDTICKITDEMCELFPYSLFHLGGDEVPHKNWKKCPDCQKKLKEVGTKNIDYLRIFIINTVAAHLKQKGKSALVWNNNCSLSGLNDDITVERWMDSKNLTISAANNGRNIITAPISPYYCDYPYGKNNVKKVYAFEPHSIKKLNENGKKHIIGTESPVWTEFINNNSRLEYLCFPRWLAVAETAWSMPQNKQYDLFSAAVVRECKRLNDLCIVTPPESEQNLTGIKALFETVKFLLQLIN